MNNPDIFTSMNLQFAYKDKFSTTQCTFGVNETINYYLQNGSNVHAILLDATKAFDRIHYIKHFQELRRRNLCPTLCRFLALQYTMQRCRVKWGSCMSNDFSASNGVKQGGVLSPILFTLYMDCLLERLKGANVGCHIGNTFAYADDIILLATTRTSMKRLIHICECFSHEYSISFNATKSKHLFFSNDVNSNPLPFEMQGSPIPIVPRDKHLGNWIGNNVFETVVEDNVNTLYRNTNLLMSQFPKAEPHVKYRLFKSYCMSVYGSQLWDYSSKKCDRFYVCWRKCIRRLFDIPSNTHCRYLHLICNDVPVDLQLHVRFINFMKSSIRSKCDIVRICANLAFNCSRSYASNSWFHICNKWDIDKTNLDINVDQLKSICAERENVGDQICAGLIHDLICLRQNTDDVSLTELIDELCVS